MLSTSKEYEAQEQANILENEITILQRSINDLVIQLERFSRKDEKLQPSILTTLADILENFAKDAENARFEIEDLIVKLEL